MKYHLIKLKILLYKNINNFKILYIILYNMPTCGTTISINILPFQLDVAVISSAISPIIQRNATDHIINLDAITITESLFKRIFYANGETFAVNQNALLDTTLVPYISLTNHYRSVLAAPFSLVDEIFKNIETDLHIHRNMLSTCSSIALNKQLTAVQTLCNLPVSNVMCSLNWSEIINAVRSEYDSIQTPRPVTGEAVLTISVAFVCPTTGVFPTVVKVNYKTILTL